MKKSMCIVLVGLLCLTLCSCASSADQKYKNFYNDLSVENGFSVPGRDCDFVQQGICAFADGSFAVCGYMNSGEDNASRIYLVEGENVKYVKLAKTDGSVYSGHAGGICRVGNYFYVSNASKLWRLSVADVVNAENGDSVAFEKTYPVCTNASFCFADENGIWVGEFHFELIFGIASYKTDESHHLSFNNQSFKAICAYYSVSDGEVSSSPQKAYALCDKVQGFALINGKCVLSTSWGYQFNSNIFVYDVSKVDWNNPDGTLSVNSQDIPLVYLGKSRLTNSYAAPSMTEEIEVYNGKLYVMLESASQKFASKSLFPQTNTLVLTLN